MSATKYDFRSDQRRRRVPEKARCWECGLWLTPGEWSWTDGKDDFCSLDCAPLDVFGLTEKDIRR